MSVPEVQTGLRRLGFTQPACLGPASRGVMEPLRHWIEWLERQYRAPRRPMLRSVSPVGIVKERPGFGQTIRPRKGSIVASPVLGRLESGPGLFLSLVPGFGGGHGRAAPAVRGAAPRAQALRALRRFRALQPVAAATSMDAPCRGGRLWRQKVSPDFVRFLRDRCRAGSRARRGRHRRDPRQSRRHARYLELDPAAARWRAAARAGGAALGASVDPLEPELLRDAADR